MNLRTLRFSLIISNFQRLQFNGSLIPGKSAHILRARLGVSLTVRLFSAPMLLSCFNSTSTRLLCMPR